MATLALGGLSNNGAKPKAMNPALYGNKGISVSAPSSSGTINLGQSSTTPILGRSSSIPLGTNPGMIPSAPAAPKPESALKKTTVTNVDGSTQTNEYHDTLDAIKQKALAIKGQLNDRQAAKSAPAAPPPVQHAPVGSTVGTQIQNVADTGMQTQNEKDTQQGLLNSGGVTDWEQEIRNGKAVDEANRKLAEFRKNAASAFADISNAGIPLQFQQGRKQVLALQFAQQEAALQAALTNALTNQGQQFAAAGTQAGRGLTSAQGAYTGAQNQAGRAAGAASTVLGAVAPQFPSYSSQVVQPGLLGASGTTGGGSIDTAIADVTRLLQSGKIGYADAQAQLSGYGQRGLDALSKWANDNNFNIAQSNTLAGQQGSIGVNYQLAETALKNVENLMIELGGTTLGGAQTTNIPVVNKVGNWISTQFGIGSEQTRAVTGAVQSLRNAYASLLASVKGGTPTDYSSQAEAEIPNEPTPNDIAAVRKNFEVLGQARRDILGNPGEAGGSGNESGTITWDSL